MNEAIETSSLTPSHGEHEQTLAYARDLRELFAELQQKERLRRALMAKLIKAQEDERRRIAIDIHDDVLQMLGFNLMKIDLVERLWEKGELEKAIEHLKGLRETIEGAINLLREIISELRPPSLDFQGLLPTLDEYLKRFQKDTGIETSLLSRLERRQQPHIETLIYRLVQEALVNVRKHSGATRVAVRMMARPQHVRVEVEDNGKGFNVDEALARSLQRGSIGLASLIERVNLAGGSYSIDSQVGHGTCVAFKLPYENE